MLSGCDPEACDMVGACAASALSASSLMRRCDLTRIPFDTTAAATGFEEFVGQERALEALRFGLAMRREGYNLFAMGPPGVGKETLIGQLLSRRMAQEPPPSDWCYVHNFRDPHRPRAIELPAGQGSAFRADMERVVAALQVSMRAAFDSDEIRTRKQRLVMDVKERQERAFADLQRRAQERQVAVVRTDGGITTAPIVGGSIVDPPTFLQLPDVQQHLLRAGMEVVGGELQVLLREFHDWGREHLERMKALDRETSAAVAKRVIDDVRTKYAASSAIVDHLSQVEADVVDNAWSLLEAGSDGSVDVALRQVFRPVPFEFPVLRRYAVNVLIDNGGASGVPVVHEPNPTHPNLIGRIGHGAQFGVLVTDFTQIKAGALHLACGGYLLLDALHLLRQPSAWEGLKRALRAREIRIESLGQFEGLVPTVSLEPDPIPLSTTKVVLIGERSIYGLLSRADPDFLELFKVIVDFDEAMERTPGSEARYANLIASLVRKEDLRTLDRAAVARVIEHAARLTGQADKISVQMRPIADLLREADACAAAAGRDVISAELVQTTIDAGQRRAGRIRERLLEAVQEGRILIDCSGERVGQVNGLSVIAVGEHQFGHPTRITARVRVGKGDVVDIEREAEMGGPIHSKGVLILAGFLGARFAPVLPLSLSASLVFEQSYVPVEGDSASLAELCALLSALADLPIKQSFAVTGSVNQHGDVQPVGGVNEKIEGFFEVCDGRGLTGAQGVLIPSANVKDLMLRRDVVEACAAGRFAVVSVDSVDAAIAYLTGREAGIQTESGRFPEGSVNALVEARLTQFAEGTRRFLVQDLHC
jgi:lon-related putative ATP-dependent protease